MLYIFVEILKLQFSGLEVSSSFPLSPIGTSDNTGFNQCFRGLEEKKNGVHFSLQAWNCENLFALIGRVVRLIIKQTFKLKVWNIIVWLCQQQHDDVVQKNHKLDDSFSPYSRAERARMKFSPIRRWWFCNLPRWSYNIKNTSQESSAQHHSTHNFWRY